MAAIVSTSPITIKPFIGSPIASTPTIIAVTGSLTPKTEAFVGPINRVAHASAAIETIVGTTASPKRFPIASAGGSVIALPNSACAKNTHDPTKSE